jgi:hypothetical protein
MAKRRVYGASDYAGLMAGEHEAYFGYEYGTDDDGGAVWGFRYTRAGVCVLEMPYAAMAQHPECPSQFEPQDCLLFGIGLVLAAGVLG